MELIVRNDYTRETELCTTETEDVSVGTRVVFQSRYGADVGTVLGPIQKENRSQWRERREIVRLATPADVDRHVELRAAAEDAEATCRERIEAHKLKMRLVGAHYVLDRSKLLFFFTAENRVDFRSLVRDLVSRFHMRVELRQIGVRDETRMVGGLGTCGRTLCCASVSDHLAPVSIRMAKDQNYSLNSMKVSGPCGRLLCCLGYEHQFYDEERKRYPREGANVAFENDSFRVHEINLLSGQVRMHNRDGRSVSLPVCAFVKEGPSWQADPDRHCVRDSQTEDDRAARIDHPVS